MLFRLTNILVIFQVYINKALLGLLDTIYIVYLNNRLRLTAYPLITTRTPPNYYTYTPPLNKLRSFHFKLEYYVCLTCLHPNRENNTTRPYQDAIVERRRSGPAGSTADSTAGSTNRLNNSTQRELSVFKRNTGCTTFEQARAQGRRRCRCGRERRHAHRGNLQTLHRGGST